jgi:predicted dehydrogenase
MKRKLRFGMIGGGRHAFIGAVHRIAARMDGRAELVAGAFSSNAARSRASGVDLHLDPKRTYGNYEEMVRTEARLPSRQRLDFVVIVTPNHQHFRPAKLFLEAGFNVICDKPLALNLAEAKALQAIARRSGKVFVLTHNYSGNAMAKQARALVKAGRLGKVRKVIVEYSQGWLATPLEAGGHKQASWRTDPKRSGASGCIGDIGTHAAHLASYVTGLRITKLCADLTTFVPGRRLEDDGSILLHFQGGAKGILHASQICIGDECALTLRIWGDKAGLEWRQERPEELVLKYSDRPAETWRRGQSYLSPTARQLARVPAGCPEGFLEAFGNIYREAFRAIAAEVAGRPPPRDLDHPTIDDGVEGMRFVDAVLRSARRGSRWVSIPR